MFKFGSICSKYVTSVFQYRVHMLFWQTVFFSNYLLSVTGFSWWLCTPEIRWSKPILHSWERHWLQSRGITFSCQRWNSHPFISCAVNTQVFIYIRFSFLATFELLSKGFLIEYWTSCLRIFTFMAILHWVPFFE